MQSIHPHRRAFIGFLGAASSGLVLFGCGRRQPGEGEKEERAEEGAEEVSPAEDLMREHGVLNRVLLLYEESARRIESRKDFDPAVLASAAGIIRRFIEEYHEKLEEDFLFPRFEKAGKLTDLVAVLRTQHQAGRGVTAQIESLAKPSTLKTSAERRKLGDALRTFIRMYRPHEAREDTVLFPALRTIVSPHEYDALGEQFEDEEHKRFGEEGFERIVDEVAGLEKSLGIYELAQFTPTM
jgi:hemerythrin-like domain-containing protein